MQLVKLINPADSPRHLHYVHQEEIIDLAPGQERVVLFDLVAAAFGHPKETDVPNNRARTDNYNRIRAQWGYQTGALDAAEDWETHRRPHFRVETLDGEFMPMILDDPLGIMPLPGDTEEHPLPVDPSVLLLQRTISEQQHQIETMQQLMGQFLAAQQPGVLPPTDASALDATNVSALPTPVDAGLAEDSPVTAADTTAGDTTTSVATAKPSRAKIN